MLSDKLVKPAIEIEGYRVEWTPMTEGIPESEVTEFKTFIRDAIPYLGSVQQAADQLHKQIEKTKNLDRHQVGTNVFNVLIQLRHNVKARPEMPDYVISMTWDGAIFIDREYDRVGETPKKSEYIADLT
jgi:hypothetical protein